VSCLVELCCGTAALTRHILGAPKSPVSYAGAKAGFVHRIVEFLEQDFFDEYHLNDLGDWSIVWDVITNAESKILFLELANQLTENPMAPKELWKSLKVELQKEELANHKRAVYYLFAIAGTYGSAEVGGFKGLHKRRPNVDGYIPSRKTIVSRARKLMEFPWNNIRVSQLSAEACKPRPDATCYIDPPYLQSSKVYKNLLSREVVEKIDQKLACSWCASNHLVENEVPNWSPKLECNRYYARSQGSE